MIVTNNKANAFSPVVVVIPLKRNLERVYPHELLLPNHRTNLDRDSKAQATLIRHVNINRIQKTLGFVPDDLMLALDSRIRGHLRL